jgi:hypothetical protein
MMAIFAAGTGSLLTGGAVVAGRAGGVCAGAAPPGRVAWALAVITKQAAQILNATMKRIAFIACFTYSLVSSHIFSAEKMKL